MVGTMGKAHPQMMDCPFSGQVGVFLIPSASRRHFYLVNAEILKGTGQVSITCTCPGYSYKKDCSHCEAAWVAIRDRGIGGGTRNRPHILPNPKRVES